MSLIQPEIKVVTRFFGAYDTSTNYSSSHNNQVQEFQITWRDFGKFVERKPPDYMYLHDVTVYNYSAWPLAVEIVINDKVEIHTIGSRTFERIVPYNEMVYDWEDDKDPPGYDVKDQSPCCLKLAIKVEDSAPDKVLWWRRICKTLDMEPPPDDRAFEIYDESKELVDSQPTVEAARLIVGLLISAETKKK